MTTGPGQPARAGQLGLAGIGASAALTFAVAVMGPSVMEPVLPGRAGQPPWAFAAYPSPYLAVGSPPPRWRPAPSGWFSRYGRCAAAGRSRPGRSWWPGWWPRWR